MPPSLLAAALAPYPIVVPLAGRDWEIPALPAREWIRAVARTDAEAAVMPGLLEPEDAERLMDRAMAGRVASADLRRASYEAITQAAGRDWWQAVRLVGAADDPLGRMYGELTLRGVDAGAVSFAAWCAAVYTLLSRNLDANKIAKLHAQLMLVPEGLSDDDLGDAPTDREQIAALLKVMPEFRMSE